MAIDTAAKRRGVPIGPPGMPGIVVYPEPDGTINEADRAQVTAIYPGIDFDTPGGAPIVSEVPHRGILLLGIGR